MTTLHLLPSTGHQTASTLKQNALVLFDEAQSLRRALQSLETSWQGGGQVEFAAQANALLRQLQTQADALQILADRLEREITEWEQTDQRGAAAFRGSSGGAAFFLGYLPPAGGLGNGTFLNRPILPVFTALSVMPFLSGLPAWLNSLLDRFFPPPTIISPIVEEPVVQPGALKRLIDEKLPPAQPPQATPPALSQGDASRSGVEGSAQVTPPSPASGYDAYYDIPPKAQGTLYGSAACLPTSMSMVLDYYHSKNSANAAASPSDLVGMLDQGDGTSGSGIGLDKLNDDLGELGYNSAVRAGNMDELGQALKDGPVIVNSQVGLVSVPARDITPNGPSNHSILVKGISAESVVVNDPWSGTEKVLPRATFEQMWKGGGNYMIVVKPQGSAQ